MLLRLGFWYQILQLVIKASSHAKTRCEISRLKWNHWCMLADFLPCGALSSFNLACFLLIFHCHGRRQKCSLLMLIGCYHFIFCFYSISCIFLIWWACKKTMQLWIISGKVFSLSFFFCNKTDKNLDRGDIHASSGTNICSMVCFV